MISLIKIAWLFLKKNSSFYFFILSLNISGSKSKLIMQEKHIICKEMLTNYQIAAINNIFFVKDAF